MNRRGFLGRVLASVVALCGLTKRPGADMAPMVCDEELGFVGSSREAVRYLEVGWNHRGPFLRQMLDAGGAGHRHPGFLDLRCVGCEPLASSASPRARQGTVSYKCTYREVA
jgi:hypothetical protein